MAERFLDGIELTDGQQQSVTVMCVAAGRILVGQYGAEASPARRPLAETALTARESVSIDELIDEGQDLVDQRFGKGWPDFQYQYGPSNKQQLGYNNGWHARKFGDSSDVLGEALDYSPTAKRLHQLVAKWHDSVQDTVIAGRPRLGEDEHASTEEVVDRMRCRNLAPALAEVVAYGILGTWPIADKQGNVVGQWGALAPDDYYPSADTKCAAQTAAVCDLSRLYAPESPYNAHMLYAQRQGVRPHETPSLDTFSQFAEGQLNFLTNYRYAIPVANKLFTGLRLQVLSYNIRVLGQVARGVIEWDELLQQDLNFAREHGMATSELALA